MVRCHGRQVRRARLSDLTDLDCLSRYAGGLLARHGLHFRFPSHGHLRCRILDLPDASEH